jgi:hypothetical protein
MSKLLYNPWKSMTLQGTVATVTPYIVNSFYPGAFSPKVQAAATVIGVLWAMLGARNAVEKAAGKSVADLADKIIGKASTPRPPAP